MNNRFHPSNQFQRQGSQTSYNTATTQASNNYQSVIDSQFRTQQNQQPNNRGAGTDTQQRHSYSDDDLEEELKDQVDDDEFLEDHIDPRFRKISLQRDNQIDDFDIDGSDTEQELRDMEDFNKEFMLKNDNEKLKMIATKTQRLYERAMEFDKQMIQLNKTYNFLDNGVKYEESRIKPSMIPQNQNIGVGTPNSK